MHTEYASSKDGMKEKGDYPQVRHIVKFPGYRISVALMRKQLAIGETTYTDRHACRTR